MKKNTISIILPNFGGGGAERAYLEIAKELAKRDYFVEFVLMHCSGELLDKAQSLFSVGDLKCNRLRNLPKILISYLQKNKPDFLIASMWPLTVIAPFSQLLSKHKCKVLICEQNYLSAQYQNRGWLNWILMRISMAIGYRLAYSRLGVSVGVINDIVNLSGLPKKMFKLVYNPVPIFKEPSKKLINHAEQLWSCPSGARIITVGSFKSQKNHSLLLKAFAKLNITDAKLMFVGEGKGREPLSLLVEELGLADKIIFAGVQTDTTPFYLTADLFVLSSNYEGFGNVIVEALACGTPIVSTDCPSGPSEILKKGQFGKLVPVNDINALAIAISQQIKAPLNRDLLIKRALDFSPEKITNKYLCSLGELN